MTVTLPGHVKLALVEVKAGTFTMGSRFNEGGRDSDESPHQVTLTRDFYIGRTGVTQAQWNAVMGDNHSSFKGGAMPVAQVSWIDAMEFCRKLNEMGLAFAGWTFTLPTEAQWEYAARGGKKSKGYKFAGGDTIGDVAWYCENSGDKTHPVAKRQSNELGLYDMSGNVWEWCRDWYEKGYAVNPETLEGNSGLGRVARGGGWDSSDRGCRSALRLCLAPGHRSDTLGFRLVLVPVQEGDRGR